MDQAELLNVALKRLDDVLSLGALAVPDDEDALKRTARAFIRNPQIGGICNLCAILSDLCAEFERNSTKDSEAADYATAADEFGRLERVLDLKYGS